MTINNYSAQVDAIINGAHERISRLNSEMLDDEEYYRASAIQFSDRLEQSVSRDRASDADEDHEVRRSLSSTNDQRHPNYDDGDFSDESWLV